MTATETRTPGEILREAYESDVVLSVEEVGALIALVEPMRTAALDAEGTAMAAVLEADYLAAMTVGLFVRTGPTLQAIADRFAWLSGVKADRKAGARIKASAALVVESIGTLRWSVAWGTVRTEESARRVANMGEEAQEARKTLLEGARLTESSLATVEGLLSEGGSVERVLALAPEAAEAIDPSVLRKALAASVKAHAGQPGQTPDGEGTEEDDGTADSLPDAIHRLVLAVRGLHKSATGSEHRTVTPVGLQAIKDARTLITRTLGVIETDAWTIGKDDPAETYKAERALHDTIGSKPAK